MIEIVSEEFNVEQEFYLERLEAVAKELQIDPAGAIVIKLGNRAESQELNRQYLQKDYPTDVLSFPLNEQLPEGLYVGDIFICYPAAEEQAKEYGVPLTEELFRLMVHGILHLSGYDHETDSGQMEELEERLMEKYLKTIKNGQ